MKNVYRFVIFVNFILMTLLIVPFVGAFLVSMLMMAIVDMVKSALYILLSANHALDKKIKELE